MGVEENDDQAINLLEVQPEIPKEEPIGQVFSQEPEDASKVEPSTESEDQERFEETVKFQEEVDIPNVQESKPQREKAIKSKVRNPKNKPKDKPISHFHNELRKHSDARKKAEHEILDIRKELKDLLLVHHATIKDLRKQVAQMHRKIATIDSSKKSTKVKTTGKKTTRVRKTSSGMKSKKKNSQKKSRKR
jgi:hypothetical protein